ncbi:MAG: hypothetical protein JWN99_392, partial [Ilumatobacteraceae bacterium]|nr:hypothetical protein [Ilumatobacteraceae bacterium]
AFVCRKAIADRIDAMRGAGNDASTLSAQPMVDDQGAAIGADLESAATLLTAVLDRVEATIGADESAAQQLAADTISATTDLATAERLASELGQYVQRVAGVRDQLDSAGRRPEALRAAAAAATQVRTELQSMADERDQLFTRWAAIPAALTVARQREAEVHAVVERCHEKVRPLPNLAVPSVDALGATDPVDQLRAMPWPAARAVMQPYLERVDRLDDAYDEVQQRFAAVLAKRDELRGLLQGFRDKAGGSGFAEDPDLEPQFRAAETELWSAPCDVDHAAVLVDNYTAAVNQMIAAAARPANDRGAT